MAWSKVLIYSWPWSQNCIGCKNSEFVQSYTFDSSNYICNVECEENDGVDCPSREDDGNEDNEDNEEEGS